MKRIAIVLLVFGLLAAPASAADYVLKITIPDAWVQDTAAAFDSRFNGREKAGMTQAQWVKYHVIQWMKNEIVVPYKDRILMEQILEQYYEPTDPDNIEIE